MIENENMLFLKCLGNCPYTVQSNYYLTQFQYKDTVLPVQEFSRQSHHYNRNSYTGNTASLYWNGPQVLQPKTMWAVVGLAAAASVLPVVLLWMAYSPQSLWVTLTPQLPGLLESFGKFNEHTFWSVANRFASHWLFPALYREIEHGCYGSLRTG